MGYPLRHLFRIFRDGIPTQTFIQDFQGWYSNKYIYSGFLGMVFPLRHLFIQDFQGWYSNSDIYSGFLGMVFSLIHLFMMFRDGIPTHTFI